MRITVGGATKKGQVTASHAAQGIQSEPLIETHLQLAFSAAIFEDTLCDGSAHTIESFQLRTVERGKEDCGFLRSLAEMCTGLFKDCQTHIPPNFKGDAHCNVIRCGLRYRYGWTMNDCCELFGQVA